MDDCTILYIYPVTDADGIHIAAQHGIEPDAAIAADDYVSDDGGIFSHIGVFANFGCETANRFYEGHY